MPDPVLEALDQEADERARRFAIAKAVVRWARDPNLPPLADDVAESLAALTNGDAPVVELEPGTDPAADAEVLREQIQPSERPADAEVDPPEAEVPPGEGEASAGSEEAGAHALGSATEEEDDDPVVDCRICGEEHLASWDCVAERADGDEPVESETKAEPSPSQGPASSRPAADPAPPSSPSAAGDEPPPRRRGRKPSTKEIEEEKERLLGFLREHPGSNQTQIASGAFKNRPTPGAAMERARKHLAALREEGKAKFVEHGNSKRWQPAGEADKRMPVVTGDDLRDLRGDASPGATGPTRAATNDERLVVDAVHALGSATAEGIAEWIDDPHVNADYVRRLVPPLLRRGVLSVENGPGGPRYSAAGRPGL